MSVPSSKTTESKHTFLSPEQWDLLTAPRPNSPDLCGLLWKVEYQGREMMILGVPPGFNKDVNAEMFDTNSKATICFTEAQTLLVDCNREEVARSFDCLFQDLMSPMPLIEGLSERQKTYFLSRQKMSESRIQTFEAGMEKTGRKEDFFKLLEKTENLFAEISGLRIPETADSEKEKKARFLDALDTIVNHQLQQGGLDSRMTVDQNLAGNCPIRFDKKVISCFTEQDDGLEKVIKVTQQRLNVLAHLDARRIFSLMHTFSKKGGAGYHEMANRARNLLDAWKKGDLETVEKLAALPDFIMGKSYEHDEVIQISKKIEQLLLQDEKVFAMLPLASLIGNEGVLSTLKEKEFSVIQWKEDLPYIAEGPEAKGFFYEVKDPKNTVRGYLLGAYHGVPEESLVLSKVENTFYKCQKLLVEYNLCSLLSATQEDEEKSEAEKAEKPPNLSLFEEEYFDSSDKKKLIAWFINYLHSEDAGNGEMYANPKSKMELFQALETATQNLSEQEKDDYYFSAIIQIGKRTKAHFATQHPELAIDHSPSVVVMNCEQGGKVFPLPVGHDFLLSVQAHKRRISVESMESYEIQRQARSANLHSGVRQSIENPKNWFAQNDHHGAYQALYDGDEEALRNRINPYSPEVSEFMYGERNQMMTDKFEEAMLQSKPGHLTLCAPGVNHVISRPMRNDGMTDLLRQRSWTVTQI